MEFSGLKMMHGTAKLQTYGNYCNVCSKALDSNLSFALSETTGDDAIAPLPIYGAPPQPFLPPEPEISNLAPPPPAPEEEELPLAQYGAGARQGRRGRFGSRRRQG